MELLTLKDAAERAGCSTKTLRNRIKSGELRALMKDGKHGPTYFVPEAELLRMLAIEAPGGRQAPTVANAPRQDSTVPASPEQGSSTVDEQDSTVPPPLVPGISSEMVLRLTDRIEQQATELGKYMAITERAESLQERERQLQTERDRLAMELAEARAELTVLRRDQLREGQRWFGRRRRREGKASQGSSTPDSTVSAGAR